MKFLRSFSLMLLIALLAMGCANDALFQDNFSNTNNNWDHSANSTVTTDYYNNAYRITVNSTNFDAWANPGNLSFTDIQVEVDAVVNSGPEYNDYGIICRYLAKDKFYYGVVGSDGFYGIFKKTSQGGQQISSVGEQFSDKILKGPSKNHIRFDCVGSKLTLYVNGTQLDQQTDMDYTSGNVGLIAGTYTDPGVDILFDNITVYQP